MNCGNFPSSRSFFIRLKTRSASSGWALTAAASTPRRRNIIVMPCTAPSLGRPIVERHARVGGDVAVARGVDEDLPANRLAPGLGVHQHGNEAVALDDRFDGRQVAERAHAGVLEHPVEDDAHPVGVEPVRLGALGKVRPYRRMNRPPRSMASWTKPWMTCLVRSLVCQMLTSALAAMPPTLGQRSSRRTFAPCRAAQHAAEMPAVPPPQTTTSASARMGISRAGRVMPPVRLVAAFAVLSRLAQPEASAPRLPPAVVRMKLRRVVFM